MARNAGNTEVKKTHLRLLKLETEVSEQDVRDIKSKFAAQMNSFADDLEAQIEMIKNW